MKWFAQELDFESEIVFVSVKTQDVEKTCKQIKPFVGNIPIVMMQNGVISSEIAGSIFGKKNIVGCTLLLNAQFQKPGIVTYVNENPSVIGKAFGKNEPWIEEIQALLSHVAKTKISESILGVQWSKLSINAMSNALDGMTGLPLGEYIRYGGLRRIGVLLLKEALGLVKKSDIQLEPLPGIPLAGFRFMISLPVPSAALGCP